VAVWAMLVAFLGNRNSQVENWASIIVVDHQGHVSQQMRCV
jgi:hypothetical protein